MTKRWYIALAVLVVATALAGGLVVVVRAQSVQGAGAPAISAPPTSAPTPVVSPSTPPASPKPTAAAPGPPAGTVHVDDRYRARYAGRYVGWDELLARGRPLPAVTCGMSRGLEDHHSGQGPGLGESHLLCLDQLTGNGFHPQGVGGTSTTRDYAIGGRPAADRNIVAISSYSRKEEKGLRFANKPGTTDATRLTVIDLDRRVYNQVELVRLVGDRFSALDSHGSGVVWVGQYLYSSSLRHLWMYNADDLMEIDGRFVLPAVAHWRARGTGGFSSISVDADRQSQDAHVGQLHPDADVLVSDLPAGPRGSPPDRGHSRRSAVEPRRPVRAQSGRGTEHACPGSSWAATSRASAPSGRTAWSTPRR